MNIMIDNKISNILSLLDSKKSTYPNLSSVWKYYIINKLEQFNKELDNGLHINSCKTSKLNLVSRRISNGSLDCSKINKLGIVLPTWESGLMKYIESLMINDYL